MIRFTIPYPKKKQMAAFCREYGLNAIYSGKHWSRRKADKEYWRCLVSSELKRQRIARLIIDKPVEIIFRWNDGLDCSNHAYMGKMIEDVLVGYLIKDDSRKHVKKISHEFHDKSYIEVEINGY